MRCASCGLNATWRRLEREAWVRVKERTGPAHHVCHRCVDGIDLARVLWLMLLWCPGGRTLRLSRLELREAARGGVSRGGRRRRRTKRRPQIVATPRTTSPDDVWPLRFELTVHVPVSDLDLIESSAGHRSILIRRLRDHFGDVLREQIPPAVDRASEEVKFRDMMPRDSAPGDEAPVGDPDGAFDADTPESEGGAGVASSADEAPATEVPEDAESEPGTSQPAPEVPEPGATPGRGPAGARGGRRVAIWLEGVLSQENGSPGPEGHAPPRAGAKELLAKFQRAGDLVTVLTRKELDLGSEWLARHGMAGFVESVEPAPDEVSGYDLVVDPERLAAAMERVRSP